MLDKMKNNPENNLDNRALRDNFKNIHEFMNTKEYDNKNPDEEQMQRNRDMRDNFKDEKVYNQFRRADEPNRPAGSD